MVDGHVRVDAALVIAHRAGHGDIGIESVVKARKAVLDAPGELGRRAAGADAALDAALPELDERVLGACGDEVVGLVREKRAVDIEECSLDHTSSFLPLGSMPSIAA